MDLEQLLRDEVSPKLRRIIGRRNREKTSERCVKRTARLNVYIPVSAFKMWHIEQIEHYEDARSKCRHTYTNRNNLFGQNLLFFIFYSPDLAFSFEERKT